MRHDTATAPTAARRAAEAEQANSSAPEADGRGLLRPVYYLERALTVLGWIALALIMFLVTADVFMRYMFRAPISWVFDFVSLYLMVCVLFFGLADTLRHNEHVAVDIIYGNLRGRTKAVCDAIMYAAGTIVFSVLFYTMAVATVESFAAREVMAGLIPWPVWAGYALVPLGTFPVLVLCIRRLFASAVRLISPVSAPVKTKAE